MASRNFVRGIVRKRSRQDANDGEQKCKWCGRHTTSRFCRSCVSQGFHWVYDFTGAEGRRNRAMGERWNGVIFVHHESLPYPVYPSDIRRREERILQRLSRELATA